MNKSLKKLREITKELAEEIRDDCDAEDSLFNLVTTIFDFLPVICEIVTPDHQIVYINNYTKERIKMYSGKDAKVGETCYESIWGLDKPCENCPVVSALDDGVIKVQEWSPPKNPDHKYQGEVITIPLRWNGTSAILLVGRGEEHDWNR